MIYESINTEFCFVLRGSKRLQFKPGPDRITRKDGSAKSAPSRLALGVLDSASKAVQLASGLDEKAIDAMIEGSLAYRDRVIGESGVWRREARVTAESREKKRGTLEAVFQDLSDDELRTMLTVAFKVEVPMKATKPDLVKLAVEAQYGKSDAAVATPAPAPEIPPNPVDEAAAPGAVAATSAAPEIPPKGPNPEDEAQAPAEASVATNSPTAAVVTPKKKKL